MLRNKPQSEEERSEVSYRPVHRAKSTVQAAVPRSLSDAHHLTLGRLSLKTHRARARAPQVLRAQHMLNVDIRLRIAKAAMATNRCPAIPPLAAR